MIETVIAVLAAVFAALALGWHVHSTLDRRADGHDTAIGDLRRAVALLTVHDNRPTGTHRSALPKAQNTAVSPSPLAAEERARLAAELDATALALAEAGPSLAEPQPAEAVPSLAESQPRQAASNAALSLLGTLTRARQEPDVRKTRQMLRPAGAGAGKIPLGEALAAVERALPGPPPEVEARILGVLQARHRAAPTRDSEAAEHIEARYFALCELNRRAGCPVDHCRKGDCAWDDATDHADFCMCACDGCVAALVIYRLAEREVMGPGIGPDSDGDRTAIEGAPSSPLPPPFVESAPAGSGPAPAALPSVADDGDEDSEDDPNTRLMTKPTAAELAVGAAAATAPPFELPAVPVPLETVPPPAPPKGTIRVMGIAPPAGAPPRSTHRPPPAPVRSDTLASAVLPLLAGAKVGGDDEMTIRQDPEASG